MAIYTDVVSATCNAFSFNQTISNDLKEACEGMVKYTIWASSRENLLLPYANKKGADQTAHTRSLTSLFAFRCLDGIIPLVFIQNLKPLASFCS